MNETDDTQDCKPWHRLPGEPALWYDRLDKYYRPLGPARTLARAYNIYRQIERDLPASLGTPGEWQSAFHTWNWQQRAEAWDQDQREIAWQDEQELRAFARQRRLQVALSMLHKAEQVSDNIAQDKVSLGQASLAHKTASQELVKLLDSFDSRHEVTLQVFLKELPESIRELLTALLDSRATSGNGD